MRYLILSIVLLTGCITETDPGCEPPALVCTAVDFSGSCDNYGCVRDVTCNRAPDFGAGTTCVVVSEGRYRCTTPSVP